MSVAALARTLRALVCDDDQQHRRSVARLLRRHDIDALEAPDAAHALEVLARERLDVALLDLHMAPMSGVELLLELRADHRTALLPVICITGDHQTDTLEAAIAAGADDYVTKPCRPQELLCRLRVAVRRREVLGSVNPLSGLPGNIVLTAQVERRLRDGAAFALAHVDIDAFKAYNDRYGYVRGDDAIRLLGELLQRAAGAAGDGVPAHIGGDDFALVGPLDAVLAAADATIAAFDAAVPDLYDAADVARGGLVVADRSGALRHHPLLALSVGVAHHRDGRFASAAAMADVAAECKRAAKAHDGSWVTVDRRGA